jgi:Putative porin
MGKTFLISVVSSFVCAIPAANAQDATTDEIAAIRREIGLLMQRLDRLERAAGDEAAGQAVADTAEQAVADADIGPLDGPASRADRIALSGDFRYRHETINDDAAAVRHRERIRARFDIDASITDDVDVGIVLATGGDDPVSANQTLGGGFARKGFGIDRAFFDWRAADGLNILGGKMPNPFFRPASHYLIYDGDLNPEGMALKYVTGNWFVNLSGWFADERLIDPDATMLGAQGGLRKPLGSGRMLTAGLSYYRWRNLEGYEPLFVPVGQGNRLDGNGNYLNGFEDVEAFAQLDMQAAGRPLRLFADYVVNRAARDENEGYSIGATYGQVAGRGTWSVGYVFEKLEPDAVVAAVTDSDFGGGGTNADGHVVKFSYGFADRWGLDFTYFINERGPDLIGGQRDYRRLMADLNFRY